MERKKRFWEKLQRNAHYHSSDKTAITTIQLHVKKEYLQKYFR